MQKNKVIGVLAVILSIIPAVRADVLPPWIFPIYQIFAALPAIILVLLVEAVIAFYLVKKKFNFKIGFWRAVLMSFAANIVSFFFTFLVLDFGAVSAAASTFLLSLALSFLIELPIIYLFIKKSVKKNQWKVSALLSLFMNVGSYLLMLLFGLLMLSIR